jgi:hypothetical protein
MLQRQRGALNLLWVAVFSALLAAVAMAAIYSMRNERNLFAEAWTRLAGAAPAQAQQALDSARAALAAPDPAKGDGVMRKCVIDGLTVVSNSDCVAANPTSKAIKIHDTRGIEAPKPPVRTEAAPSSDPMIDKVLEKQLR